ncbi:hypothetical protein RRG08_002985 [Elysia crispata]|uniref:Uncharacterized protein n=1 Tax=Elysia crispata TaxID=231223 RepID=A0AAE1B4A9_9GAST|nr:hypothetical protein RRG08_002985 [Elysia crispata]
MSENRQKVDSFHRGDIENNTPYQKTDKKWTAYQAEIERTTHHVRKTDKKCGQLSIAEIEKNNTPCQKTDKKLTAFIEEIEKTTHHVRKPTKVDSFHRGDRENNTPYQKTDKKEQLSSRR